MNLLEPMFSMEFEAIQGQIFFSSPVHLSWDASIFLLLLQSGANMRSRVADFSRWWARSRETNTHLCLEDG
jgi:hypothetical protein